MISNDSLRNTVSAAASRGMLKSLWLMVISCGLLSAHAACPSRDGSRPKLPSMTYFELDF